MITLLRYPGSLLPQFFMIAFFAAMGLYEVELYSTTWWAVLGLSLSLAGIVLFWPVRKPFVVPYLAVVGSLVAALTLINQSFIFLGFLYSVHLGLLLPLRGFLISMAVYAVVVEALFIVRYGTVEAFFSGLGPLIGVFSFGYAYHQRQAAEEAHQETRRLLEELQDAHRRLEAYASQVQELTLIEERARLARELHDSVKQQAFAISAQLGAARARLRSAPEASEAHLQQAEETMDALRRELSQLIFELRPLLLQNQSLPAALRDLAAGWAQQNGIPLKVEVTGERALTQATEQELLRITQEALSNVARHSQARTAALCLEYGPETVRLVIQDDGRGFHPAQDNAAGIGLQSMRERAARLPGGRLAIDSAPGSGARVEVVCEG